MDALGRISICSPDLPTGIVSQLRYIITSPPSSCCKRIRFKVPWVVLIFTGRSCDGRKIQSRTEKRELHGCASGLLPSRQMHPACMHAEGKTKLRWFLALCSASVHSFFLCQSCLLLHPCRLTRSLCVFAPPERGGINFLQRLQLKQKLESYFKLIIKR